MLPFIIIKMFYLMTVLYQVYFQIDNSLSIIQYLFTLSLYTIKTLKGTVSFKVNYQYLDPGSWYRQLHSHERKYSFSIYQVLSKPKKNYP